MGYLGFRVYKFVGQGSGLSGIETRGFGIHRIRGLLLTRCKA